MRDLVSEEPTEFMVFDLRVCSADLVLSARIHFCLV